VSTKENAHVPSTERRPGPKSAPPVRARRQPRCRARPRSRRAAFRRPVPRTSAGRKAPARSCRPANGQARRIGYCSGGAGLVWSALDIRPPAMTATAGARRATEISHGTADSPIDARPMRLAPYRPGRRRKTANPSPERRADRGRAQGQQQDPSSTPSKTRATRSSSIGRPETTAWKRRRTAGKLIWDFSSAATEQ